MIEEQPIKRQRLIRRREKPQPIKVSCSSSIAYDSDDDNNEHQQYEDEEDIVYYNRPAQQAKRQQQYPSTSPEPNSPNKRKKLCADPNRKDKIGRTRIFSATTAGHLDKVQELIALGANVNFKDNANWTPLHEAASHGRFEIAQLLIDHGAKINVRGYGLETPLHDACQSSSPLIVKLLVDGGANVFALNENNKRPIDLCPHNEACQAILRAKMKELDHVIKRDAQGKSLLHHACFNNELQRAQDLINQGADVNAQDNQDMTPLHYACAQGHLELAHLLFQQGALVNITANKSKGDTPLHQASRNGQTEIVQFLIQKAEADVNKKNKQGQDPYQVSSKNPPSVRQLLTAKMDELKLEKEACHALDDTARKMALQNEPERQLTREEKKIQQYMKQFAKMSGNDEATVTNENDKLLDELLDYPSSSAQPVASSTTTTTTTRKKRLTNSRKSVSVERESAPSTPTSSKRSSWTKLDPFKKDSSGSTLLHKYAMRGDCETVQQLLKQGAEPNETDNAGWTALHEAALKGHVQVVKILLDHGADVNCKGADMDTPLHDATENNHCDMVQLLLDHGANPTAKNIHHAEPIDIATQHGFQDIVAVLQHATTDVKPEKKKKKKRPKLSLVLDDEDEEDEEEEEEELQRPRRKNSKRSLTTSATSNDITTKTRKRRLIQKKEQDQESDESTLIATSSRSSSPVSPVAPVYHRRLKKLHQKRSASPSEVKYDPTTAIKEEDVGQEISTTLLSDRDTTPEEEQEERKEKENIHRSITAKNIPNKKKLSIDKNIINYKYASTTAINSYPYHQQGQSCRSPVYTPPPEQHHPSQKQLYSPLYTVQLSPTKGTPKYYLIDLQVCLFLSIENLDSYVCLNNQKILINTSTKSRLYNTLKLMLTEDKAEFVQRELYFVGLDDVVQVIKKDFSHLSDELLTITLDIGDGSSSTACEEGNKTVEQARKEEEDSVSTSTSSSSRSSSPSLTTQEKKVILPPKMALKKMMKSGQFNFQR